MKKGFTLIELLIVIGILAVLAAATILILNPAELFAQARDSQRISDLGSLQSALGLYISTQTSPALGQTTRCYVHTTAAIAATLAANCDGRHAVSRSTVASTSRAVDATGWVPVNFAAIPGGSPLGNLPMDPSNTATLFYSYAANASSTYTFELDAKMESVRYSNGGSNDVEINTKDGGNKDYLYEVGTSAGLSL